MGSFKQILKKHGCFMVVLLACSVFLLWKCTIGFGNVDESFYLTIPYRLLRGDALFVDEWHLSQMAGVLTMPVVGAYLAITGGTEGMILYMRYVCTAFQILTAVFLYVRLQKLSRTGAGVAAISYVLFIPFGIMALSYNSMAIMALVLCMTICLTAEKQKKVQYVIAGLLYAAAVLCNPYLAVIFALYVVAVSVTALIRKIRKDPAVPTWYLFSMQGALFLSLGAAVAAAAFGIFVLSRASVQELIQAFPMIMNDPEHPPLGVWGLAVKLGKGLLNALPSAVVVYSALAILAVVYLLDKKHLQRRVVYFGVAALCVLPLFVDCFRMGINFMMWPMNILALFALLLTNSKTAKRIFCAFWGVGMLYAICLTASSNQGFAVTASASAVSLVGSILMIFVLVTELLQEQKTPLMKKAGVALLALLMVIQLGGQAVLRYQTVFWEEQSENRTERIQEGVSAGLLTTEAWEKSYEKTLEYLRVVETYQPKTVLHLTLHTWNYLNADHEMGAYSAWLAGISTHTVDRLKSYYELNPEKWPDVVYVNAEKRAVAEYFCDQCGYKIDWEDESVLLLIKA